MYSKFIKKQPTEMKQSLEKNAFETKNQWEYEKKPKVLEVGVAYTQCICMHGAANMWLKHKNSQQKHEKNSNAANLMNEIFVFNFQFFPHFSRVFQVSSS